MTSSFLGGILTRGKVMSHGANKLQLSFLTFLIYSSCLISGKTINSCGNQINSCKHSNLCAILHNSYHPLQPSLFQESYILQSYFYNLFSPRAGSQRFPQSLRQPQFIIVQGVFSYASSSTLYPCERASQWVIVLGCNCLAQLGACFHWASP